MKKLVFAIVLILVLVIGFNHFNNVPPVYRSVTLSYFGPSSKGFGQRLHIAVVERPKLVEFSFIGSDLVIIATTQDGNRIKSDFRLVHKAVFYLQKGLRTKKYIIGKINNEYYLNYHKYPSAPTLAFDFTNLYKYVEH